MNNTLVEGQHGHGALGHILKPTDWLYNNLAPKGTVPFDWQVGYDVENELAVALGAPGFRIPAKNQGTSGSCGPQAISYYDEILKAFVTKKFVRRSGKFTYPYVVQPGGGSYGGDLMSSAKSRGVSTEELCPSYEHDNTPPSEEFMTRLFDITPAAIADAATAHSNGYSFITEFDIDTLAQAVRDNHGIIILIDGQNNGTWRSDSPFPPTAPVGSALLWRHWLYVGKAKMVGGRKVIIVLNSWGPFVGALGWQEISEDYVKSGHVQLGMVMGMSPDSPYNFTKDLSFGMTDADVFFLQKRLNADPDTMVSKTGIGSPGSETYHFGELTKNAVIRFQLKHKITPVLGYVGILTRAALNKVK